MVSAAWKPSRSPASVRQTPGPWWQDRQPAFRGPAALNVLCRRKSSANVRKAPEPIGPISLRARLCDKGPPPPIGSAVFDSSFGELRLTFRCWHLVSVDLRQGRIFWPFCAIFVNVVGPALKTMASTPVRSPTRSCTNNILLRPRAGPTARCRQESSE